MTKKNDLLSWLVSSAIVVVGIFVIAGADAIADAVQGGPVPVEHDEVLPEPVEMKSVVAPSDDRDEATFETMAMPEHAIIKMIVPEETETHDGVTVTSSGDTIIFL